MFQSPHRFQYMMNQYDTISYNEMENYERRKLYRIHLRNISEIKNCKNPKSHIGYSSRLYNYDLGVSLNKQRRETRSPKKTILTNIKRSQQNHLLNLERQKENLRITTRILNTHSSIKMSTYEREYQKHRKIMKMHCRVKQKRVIMYRIHDIKFKGATPDLAQVFFIFEIAARNKKKNNLLGKTNKLSELKLNHSTNASEYKDSTFHFQASSCNQESCLCTVTQNNPLFSAQTSFYHEPEPLLSGNIYQIRQSMIKGFVNEKMKLRVQGRLSGEVILQQTEMVPIMKNKEIIGTMIVQMY